MTTSVSLRPLLDRKEWEMMTPCPTTNGDAMFTITDPTGEDKGLLYICSTSVIYRYDHNQDGWQQIPASGIAGAFANGACGAFHHMGATGNATAGTTTTITTNLTVNRSMAGYTVRITAGPNAGLNRVIESNTLGANSVFTVTEAYPVAITTASAYQFMTGRYWFFNAGTSSVGFAVYDRMLNTWTQRSVTGLPTAWGTDGRLVSTCTGSNKMFATGTSTGANTTTTLNNVSKAWAVNSWTNYQVRISAGTGAGQVRVIASNTATALTVGVAWTITPDATSEYIIDGNEDVLYLLGNNAVTMYKYTISTNTWATITPATARGGSFASGGGANWVFNVDGWDNENDILNGSRIYAFRGGASTALDYYDITENKWYALTYVPQTDTYTTGSSYDYDDNYIMIQKESTGRFFRYMIKENRIIPFSTLMYPDSTARNGDKIWTKTYIDGSTKIKWLYKLRSSGTELFRCMMID